MPETNEQQYSLKKHVWHCSCYSDATNTISMQQARDHLFLLDSMLKKPGHKRTLSEMNEIASTSNSEPSTI